VLRGAESAPCASGVRHERVETRETSTYHVVGTELAVARPELDARLSEEGVQLSGTGRVHFDPHVISDALRQLEALGRVGVQQHSTKGGRTVSLLVPGDTTGRTTYVTRAVRRKGMLYNRFRNLADESGEAGEAVLRHSLREAGPHLIPMTPGFGEVRTVMKTKLHGALDSGAWLHTLDPETQTPRTAFAVPMEMKNRRLTLYPLHKEVHQLLSKAAELQVAHPHYPIVPVLVCRRAHSRLFWMAKDLGFRVWATNRQFTTLPREMDQRRYDEVRTELRPTDLTLVPATGPPPTIQQFFRETIVAAAPLAAPRWAAAASTVLPYAQQLRSDDVASADRQHLVRELRQELEGVMPAAGFDREFLSWSLPDLEDQ